MGVCLGLFEKDGGDNRPGKKWVPGPVQIAILG